MNGPLEYQGYILKYPYFNAVQEVNRLIREENNVLNESKSL